MRKLKTYFLISTLYLIISFSIFSNIGWEALKNIYIPISYSIMIQFYIFSEMRNDFQKNIKSTKNIILFSISLILFIGSFIIL